jgi:hypothetical protein
MGSPTQSVEDVGEQPGSVRTIDANESGMAQRFIPSRITVLRQYSERNDTPCINLGMICGNSMRRSYKTRGCLRRGGLTTSLQTTPPCPVQLRNTQLSPSIYYLFCYRIMNTFLTVPITVREQIYHELLTYTPSTINFQLPIASAPSERYFPKAAPASPLCRLLTLNRQIHAEVLQYLRSQLCVVPKSNLSRFTVSIFDERALRVPLISQLQSRDGSVKKDFSKFPVAMEWDICVFQRELEAESASWFLIPATSLPTLIQNARKWVVW